MTPVFWIVLAVLGLLAAATLSAVAAYRWSGSAAWGREYDVKGIGLSIELAYLALTVAAAAAISMIMSDSFRSIFVEGGWRSPWYVGSAAVMAGGVALYMLVFAPPALARKQKVPGAKLAGECRRPYLLYAPFSIISWAGFVLPVLAILVVSIGADQRTAGATERMVLREGAAAVERAGAETENSEEHAALFALAYRDGVDTIQRMVSRYLWVVGVFMIFVIVILNTHITSAFAEESQDAFKWLMWVLLLVAVGICALGLDRYQGLRDLAIGTQTRLHDLAAARGDLGLLAAAREALLAHRNEGPVTFLRMMLDGGSLWLMFFGYAGQIVMAKVTHRSVVKVIFPRPVARFLDSFMLPSEERDA